MDFNRNDMMEQEEIWKDVVGYKGMYQVSNIGRTKTMSRNIYSKGSIHYIMKERVTRQTDFKGYKQIRLRKDNLSRLYFVHRLVLMAFIPNPFNKPYVNHKNGIRNDNRVENLEWCTRSENEKHAYKYLSKELKMNRPKGKDHFNSYPVVQKDKNGNILKIWECAKQAKIEGGYCNTCIGLCVNGRMEYHKGFKWERQ